MPFLRSSLAAVIVVSVAVPSTARAQDERRSLDLTIGGVGLSIGDSRGAKGLRLNFRDGRLEQATGINATIWTPFKGGHGNITGLALGLPSTGGQRIDGLHISVFGAEVTDRFTGISIAGLGLGVGHDATGLTISGFGMGAGHNFRGVSLNGLGGGVGGDFEGFGIGGLGFGGGGNARGALIGGLGAGVGGNVRGFALGGLGVGAGGRVDGLMVGGLGVGAGGGGTGILIGGLGAGVGGDFDGLLLGGLGAGVGGNFRGIAITGLGMGAGGDASGFFVNLGGMGAGGTIRYLSINGLGAGASRIEGASLTAGLISTPHAKGLMLAGVWLRIRRFEDEPPGRTGDYDARLEGVGISSFTQVLGHQNGLTIGLVNYARSLNGVQLGLINIVRDNPSGRKVLPVINWGNTRR